MRGAFSPLAEIGQCRTQRGGKVESFLQPAPEEKKRRKKPTTPAVPRRSPIQVLGRPDTA